MSEPSTAVAVVHRELPAPPHVCYAEWLDPGALGEFMAPLPHRAANVRCDARVGGTFHIDMVSPEGTVHIGGTYLELEPPRRLRFTWDSDFGDGFESIVTVTFEPVGDERTRMTIRHEQLPRPLAGDHERGWASIAERLDARLGGGGHASSGT
jgi:uncharacterized protein YndB with AHSA1/START domain